MFVANSSGASCSGAAWWEDEVEVGQLFELLLRRLVAWIGADGRLGEVAEAVAVGVGARRLRKRPQRTRARPRPGRRRRRRLRRYQTVAVEAGQPGRRRRLLHGQVGRPRRSRGRCGCSPSASESAKSSCSSRMSCRPSQRRGNPERHLRRCRRCSPRRPGRSRRRSRGRREFGYSSPSTSSLPSTLFMMPSASESRSRKSGTPSRSVSTGGEMRSASPASTLSGMPSSSESRSSVSSSPSPSVSAVPKPSSKSEIVSPSRSVATKTSRVHRGCSRLQGPCFHHRRPRPARRSRCRIPPRFGRASHPSPGSRPPSSHCSPRSTMAFPQVSFDVQVALQRPPGRCCRHRRPPAPRRCRCRRSEAGSLRRRLRRPRHRSRRRLPRTSSPGATSPRAAAGAAHVEGRVVRARWRPRRGRRQPRLPCRCRRSYPWGRRRARGFARDQRQRGERARKVLRDDAADREGRTTEGSGR